MNSVLQKNEENVSTFTDHQYQYSGLGDKYIENTIFLEKGRYRMKGYFKPGKKKDTDLSIIFLGVEDASLETGIKYRTPHQQFSKILRVYASGNYKINVECEDEKRWAFSILPL